MAKEVKSLEGILMADIKKDDKAKAQDKVARVVRDAKHSAQGEIHNAVVELDKAEDKLNSVVANPASSLVDIMNADRAAKLAESNLQALQAIFADRFPA